MSFIRPGELQAFGVAGRAPPPSAPSARPGQSSVARRGPCPGPARPSPRYCPRLVRAPGSRRGLSAFGLARAPSRRRLGLRFGHSARPRSGYASRRVRAAHRAPGLRPRPARPRRRPPAFGGALRAAEPPFAPLRGQRPPRRVAVPPPQNAPQALHGLRKVWPGVRHGPGFAGPTLSRWRGQEAGSLRSPERSTVGARHPLWEQSWVVVRVRVLVYMGPEVVGMEKSELQTLREWEQNRARATRGFCSGCGHQWQPRNPNPTVNRCPGCGLRGTVTYTHIETKPPSTQEEDDSAIELQAGGVTRPKPIRQKVKAPRVDRPVTTKVRGIKKKG